MNYVQKQKFNIQELFEAVPRGSIVGVIEPERYLAKLYEKYLQAHGFTVLHFQPGELLTVFVERVSPKLVLLASDNASAYDHIERIRRHNPHILLVTIAHNANQEDIEHFMSHGVTSHINRKLSRPQDVADIIRGLITI